MSDYKGLPWGWVIFRFIVYFIVSYPGYWFVSAVLESFPIATYIFKGLWIFLMFWGAMESSRDLPYVSRDTITVTRNGVTKTYRED